MAKYLSILCLVPFLVWETYAADSSMTITGTLKDSACLVALDSQDFTVDLMKATKFDRAGAVTPAVSFRIVLEKCGTSVRVGFKGTADTDNTTLLKLNPGSDAAKGVAIQILDKDQNAIPLNAAQGSLNWTTLKPGQSNTLIFHARMMATRTPVTPGVVLSRAYFTLEYQ